MKRDLMLENLAEYLNIDKFEDYCVNGMQVEGNPIISRISTAVSVSDRLFQQAIKSKSDLIIVHHGLFWKSQPSILTGILRNRVKLLLENDINLAAYHLPLDAHPEIGNNAQILESLGIQTKTPIDVGFIGEFPAPVTISSLTEKLDRIMPDTPLHLNYGADKIHRIAVISGGASTRIEMVANLDVDVFISGDLAEPVVRTAEELGIHFFSAGHYNTERFGPIALAQYIKKQFSIPAEFIEIPNPA